MNQYAYLLQDPRPEFEQDSHLWVTLLRSAVQLPELDKSYIISNRLWSLRNAGTLIKRTHIATRFEPVLSPQGDWDSIEFFDNIKRDHLLPYADDIKILLDALA